MHVIRHYAYIENKKVNDIKLIKCESEYDLRGYKKEIPSNKNILNEIYIDFEVNNKN
jgi:hypothetical protein